MSDTHEKFGSNFKRSNGYYHKLLTKFCGEDYQDCLRPSKRNEVRRLLQRPKDESGKPIVRGITWLVHGVQQEVRCFRAEAFYLSLHNGLTCIRTDDSILVKLNFGELGSVPDTTIEDVTELEHPDFLWLDLCTTKNCYIAYQIMRLIDQRDSQGKRTIIYSPDVNTETWQKQYESTAFNKYLEQFIKDHKVYKVERFK